MSYRGLTITGVFSVFLSFSANAQVVNVDAYFTTKEMPDLTKIITPPEPTSPQFAYDIQRYFWGKNVRLNNPERSAIAIRDAVYGLGTIIREFRVPFGLEISRTNTPKIYKVLELSLATCDSICTLPKAYWHRTRPFVYFGEHSLTPDHENALRKNGSFPSGHSILGWSAALLLSEINPEAADTLMARGHMFAESRIICGVHWQSDIDAGRLAASIAYAKLHTSERFLQDMAEARAEFKRLEGELPPSESDSSQDSTLVKLRKAKSDWTEIEMRYNMLVHNMPLEHDENGLRMLFVKTNECRCNVDRAVDNVVLVNDCNEVVWVVTHLVRHDVDNDSFYGICVSNGKQQGELRISYFDELRLRSFLLQYNDQEFVNCSKIRFRLDTLPVVRPFMAVEDLDEEIIKFFGK